MCKKTLEKDNLQNTMNMIAQNYLQQISSLNKFKPFETKAPSNSREIYFKSRGFHILDNCNQNTFIVDTEAFLEGCTRVFLLNPIIDKLLYLHSITHEWYNDSTFSNYSITNREFELSAFLEFVILVDEKRIGFRYTRNSYCGSETMALNKPSLYTHGQNKLPGFKKFNTVDEIYVIDWSGISDVDLATIHICPPGATSISKDITVSQFFNQFFSDSECKLFMKIATDAVNTARKIIALEAVPQLLSNNMLIFKDMALKEFSKEKITNLGSQFRNQGKTVFNSGLSTDDIESINKRFFDEGYRYSLIGNSDFAKSYITSEYLFQTINKDLGIDYTSVVTGYLKSIEQLLYILYDSAFDGQRGMEYWDKCNKTEEFDISNPRYRYDPYSPEKYQLQEKYYHKKKVGKNAPEIGSLIRFLRYFSPMWGISETGKEYICSCLNDFRTYCRNHHFHKENIDKTKYNIIEQIRNNTQVCLYYLLGGFCFLDHTRSVYDQLGVKNYEFDHLYREIQQRRQHLFQVETDYYKGMAVFSHQNLSSGYNQDGQLVGKELFFIKMDGVDIYNITWAELQTLLHDSTFVEKNILKVTRENMPEKITPISIRMKK